MKAQLTAMYQSYYTDNGKCRYFAECQKELHDSTCKFCSDKIMIGAEYGKSGIPKILCVGLEGVKGEENLSENRIVKGILEPSLTAANNHYLGVRYVLSYLLGEFTHTPKPQSCSAAELVRDSYTDHLKCYALSNCYKCAFGSGGKRSGLQHTEAMKVHCQDILFDEINTLRPDVVVIQFVSNKPAKFWKNIQTQFGINHKAILLKGDGIHNNTSAYQCAYDDGQTFYLVWTYHGNGGRPLKFRSDTYLKNELNPVLDEVIGRLKTDPSFTK